MNYGEVRRMALRLLFSDTSAGQPIPADYNDQADYLAAIPSLVDNALLDIAVRTDCLTAVVPLSSLRCEGERGGKRVIALPNDCYETVAVLLPGLVPAAFRVLADRLYVEPALPEDTVVYYRRFPVSVGSAPEDSTALDGTAEMHALVPFYVAAYLVLYDDSYRYGVLRSEYENRLMALRQAKAELSPIRNVYEAVTA